MKNSNTSAISLSAFIVSLFLLAAAPAVHAATATWVGNNSTLWGDTSNWSGAQPTGNTPTFGTAGSAGTTLDNNLTANTTFTDMMFNSGASSYTLNGNAITLNTGSITNNSSVSQTINFGVTINAGQTSTFTGTSSITINGTVTGGLNDSGVINSSITGAGNLLTLSGQVNLTTPAANHYFNLSGTGNTLISGNITNSSDNTGTGNFNVTNTGITTLSGTNTYTGVTLANVAGVTLQFAKTVSLYNGNTANWTNSKINTVNGSTLAFNVGGTGEFSTGNVTTLLTNLAGGGIAAGTNLGFDTTNASGGNFVISDVIVNGAGRTRSLTKLGTNTLILTGNNTYTGNTTISQGTLQVGNGGSTGNLSTSSAIINNGTLAFSRNNTVTQGTDFASVIAGSGNVTQSGSSTLTLSGNNTYTGATLVTSGTLVVSGTGSIQNSSTTVSSTATLNVNSGGIAGSVLVNSGGFAVINGTAGAVTVNGGTLSGNSTAGDVIVQAGGNLSPGNSPGIQNFSSLTLSGNTTTTTMQVVGANTGNGTAGTTYDRINTTGNTTFGGVLTLDFTVALDNNITLDLFNVGGTTSGSFFNVTGTGGFTAYNGDWTHTGSLWTRSTGTQLLSFSEVTGDLNVIPEPATWALLAFSLTTVVVLRRRRRI